MTPRKLWQEDLFTRFILRFILYGSACVYTLLLGSSKRFVPLRRDDKISFLKQNSVVGICETDGRHPAIFILTMRGEASSTTLVLYVD